MATTQVANPAEAIGPGDKAATTQDITNPARNPKNFADPSGATMKALVWEGKNKVAVRKYKSRVNVPIPPNACAR